MNQADGRSLRRVLLALLGLFLLACIGFGFAYVLLTLGTESTPASQRFVDLEEYSIWRLLVGVNFAVWFALLPVILIWVNEAKRLLEGNAELVFAAGFLFLILAAFIWAVLDLAPSRTWPLENHLGRTATIQAVGVLAAAPAIIGMLAIGAKVRARPNRWENPTSENLNRVLGLRHYLRRFLAVLGTFIGLVILATGALRHSVVAAGFEYPSEGVVLYGALFTALVAAIYVPTFSAVEGLARQVRNRAFPMPDISSRDGDAAKGDPVKQLEDRAALGETLKLGGTAKTNLETLVLVFTPLLTSLITSALGGG